MTRECAAVVETARAKINLALHVTARRTDGYHELDSLVAFGDIGDELVLTPASQTSLQITGPFAAKLNDEPGNIILDAVQALQNALPDQFSPVAIKLTKSLPVASGIGGGSADAAAALRGLQRLFGPVADPDSLGKLALDLGADVPVCLQEKVCRMRGIGEELETIGNCPVFDAVLVNPGISVSTPQVFSEMDLKPGSAAWPQMPALPASIIAEGWETWLKGCRNDLQEPAISLAPEIGQALLALRDATGCVVHRMSGSGATCFGLFENDLDAWVAANSIAADHPGWWVCQTRIG